MTTESILEAFSQKKIITEEQAAKIFDHEKTKPFSIHWELRAMLYLGLTLLTSGLGILIYKNIDTIGHQAIILLIAFLIIFCFYYVFQKRQPFKLEKVDHATQYSEHALLLGCTLFLLLEGYLQFQYNFFGNRYGIAIFVPTLFFFFLAYRFDHRGVLSMAITGLASWLGLTISPFEILEKNDFMTPGLITTGVILGTLLCVVSWISQLKNLKSHFSFTYLFLGGNLAAIAGLAGLFHRDQKLIYFIITVLLSAFLIQYARKSHSLIFLLMGVIYGYVVITYAAFKYMSESMLAFFSIYYFLFTSVGVIVFLLNARKILGLKK